MADSPTPIALKYYESGSTGFAPRYYDLKSGTEIAPAEIGYYKVTTPEEVKSGEADITKADQKAAEQIIEIKGNGGDRQEGFAGQPEKANSQNNGYISKPAALSLAASFAPGPAGMVAKVGSLAVNAVNRNAVKTGRQVLGMEDKMALGSLISDNKGEVGNLNINGKETVPVGYEASDKTGRTNLTVNEARMRQMLTPNVTEATSEDVTDAKKNFKEQGLTAPKQESMFSKMRKNMFSKDTPATPSATGITTTTNDTTSEEEHPSVSTARGLGISTSAGAITRGINNDDVASNGSQGQIGNFDSSSLSDSARNMVGTMSDMGFGNVGVNSDRRSVASNKAAGGAKASQHLLGNAVDLSTASLSDKDKERALDSALVGGANGIGAYPSGNIHVDTREGPTTMWGAGGTYSGVGVKAMPSWARDDLQAKIDANGFSYLSSSQVPTPIDKPAQDLVASTDTQSATEGPTDTQAAPVGMMTRTVATANPTGKTSQERYSDLSDDDKKMMAMTLAGEIDPSKTDLSTEAGRQEAFGITSTMDNRVGKYGSMKGVISAPKQYSTWNNTQAATTAQKNYEANPEQYDSLVNDYYASDENNKGFTSYHATSVNPGWSASMENPTAIGPHIFGTLQEYAQPATKEVAVPSIESVPTPVDKPTQTQGFAPTQTAPNAAQMAVDAANPTNTMNAQMAQVNNAPLTGYVAVDQPTQVQAVAVNPSQESLSAAAPETSKGFSTPAMSDTRSSLGPSQNSTSTGDASGSDSDSMGGRSGGDNASAAGSMGGGFASSPNGSSSSSSFGGGDDSSDSDSDSSSGFGGYSGSRSDGWN